MSEDSESELEYEVIDTEWMQVFPDGDLVLEITDHAKQVLLYTTVWRNVVMSLSLPWSKMVDDSYIMKSVLTDGYHCKREPGKYKDLLSVEDDSFALLILLAAVHPFSGVAVPANVTYEELLALAVTCDKYDCGYAMSKDLRRYFFTHEAAATRPGRENWIFIAETFARQDIFPMEELRLVRMKLNEVGRAIWSTLELPGARGGAPGVYTRYGSDIPCDMDYIPQRHLENIFACRQRHIKEIFRELSRYDEFLVTTDWAAHVPIYSLRRKFHGIAVSLVENVGFKMSTIYRERIRAIGSKILDGMTGRISPGDWPWSSEELDDKINGEEVCNDRFTIAHALRDGPFPALRTLFRYAMGSPNPVVEPARIDIILKYAPAIWGTPSGEWLITKHIDYDGFDKL